MSDEVLIKAEGVSKKFCRSLKRSLWYGVQDVASEIAGRKGHQNNLRKNEFWAVNEVSFELRRGECIGLIGPNGAGKSTILKMLNGLVKPDKGRITLRGKVGALIELGAGFNPVLTARENIFVNGSVLGFTKKEIDRKFDAIIDFAEIEEFVDTPVQNFSSGMKVRLGFAVAAQMEPDVLLIDEVLAVGDVSFRLKCFNQILNLKNSNVGILLVSHSMVDINRVCSRSLVLANGSVEVDGEVSLAVASYLKLCHTQQVFGTTIAENLRQKLQIKYVEIHSEQSATERKFSTGENLQLDVALDATESLQDIRLWVAIYASSVGLITSISSSEDQFSLDIKTGRNKFRISLPSLQLTIGHYYLSCGVYGQGIAQVYDFKEGVCDFSIVAPRTKSFGYGSQGLFRIPHKWTRI